MDLIPSFNISPGFLRSVTEGENVYFQIETIETLTLTLLANTIVIPIGIQATRAINVSINGINISFSISGQDLIVPNSSGLCVITFISDLTFSLLCETLPPGLVISTTGLITGIVGPIIPLGTKQYEFVIRVTNGTVIRDITYIISATSAPYNIILNSLPAISYDSLSGNSYYDLGSYIYGQSFSYTLDGYATDNSIVTYSISNINSLYPDGEYGLFPKGLQLNVNLIEGEIWPCNLPGRYFFNLTCSGTLEPLTVILSILIINSDEQNYSPPTEIDWITPSGSLGSLGVGQLSYLSVSAINNLNEIVSFELSPYSNSLPQGLSLDTSTGNIIGIVGFSNIAQVYSFTVRAYQNTTFIDREFSINIIDGFVTNEIVGVNLNLTISDSDSFLWPYKNIFNTSLIYNPTNSYYGIVNNPSIYVINGLDGRKDIVNFIETPNSNAIGNDTFFKPFSLILGEHQSAVARDSNGNIIYEVIYRVLYDLQSTANEYTTPDVTLNQFVWSFQGTVKNVYSNSLNNIRNSLIANIGIPSTNSSLENIEGPTGAEIMPLFMSSEQILNDSSSIIGFIPCIVIAYCNPGTSQTLLDTISISHNIPQDGIVFEFNRLYLSNYSVDHIQFEDNI